MFNTAFDVKHLYYLVTKYFSVIQNKTANIFNLGNRTKKKKTPTRDCSLRKAKLLENIVELQQ